MVGEFGRSHCSRQPTIDWRSKYDIKDSLHCHRDGRCGADSLFGNEQILRLQISVHDAFLVRSGEPADDLVRVMNRLAKCYRPFVKALTKFFAFEQFSNDVR